MNITKNKQLLLSMRNLHFLRSFAYKSAISLENLHPNSSLKLSTITEPPKDTNEKFNGFIPIDKLDITYSRSSGPGGQNVNKVNTKVDVRFQPKTATWINDDIKNKLLEKNKNQISKEGYLVFRSELTRSQQLNLADCLEKIRSNIRNCLHEPAAPTEETIDKIRQRRERSIRERLAIKRERSTIKNERRNDNT